MLFHFYFYNRTKNYKITIKILSTKIHFSLIKAALHYGGEVHWSRIQGKWSNMIGEKLVLHKIGFTLRPRLDRWRTSSIDEKITWLPLWQHFLEELSPTDLFLVQPQPPGQETNPLEKSNIKISFLPMEIIG